MEHVLIISPPGDEPDRLGGLLSGLFEELAFAVSAGEARRMVAEKQFDLCIINAPLVDEYGVELAVSLSDRLPMQVVLLVRNDFFDEISTRVQGAGVFTLSKPTSKELLINTLKLAGASLAKLSRIRNENLQLARQLEEMKNINRAKFILSQTLGLDENRAHKYLERQAMNRRITKAALAKEILDSYNG